MLLHGLCHICSLCTYTHADIETQISHSLSPAPSITQHTHSCCHFAPCSASLHYKLSLVLLPIKWHGNLGHFLPPSLLFCLSLSVCFTLSLLLPVFSPTPSYPLSVSPSPLLCLAVFPLSQALSLTPHFLTCLSSSICLLLLLFLPPISLYQTQIHTFYSCFHPQPLL